MMVQHKVPNTRVRLFLSFMGWLGLAPVSAATQRQTAQNWPTGKVISGKKHRANVALEGR